MVLMFITAATFVILSAIILSVYYAVTAESLVEQRLKTMAPERATATWRQRGSAADQPGLARRTLANVGRYSVGGSESYLTQTLSAAGIRGASATALFLGTRTILSFGPALLVLVSQVSAGEPVGRAVGMAALVWGCGHVAVNTWLRRRARRRMRHIMEALPDCLDLMVVCLEAGLGLNPTIARVGEERASLNDPLGKEFAQVALELRSGRTREESLRALGNRNGVDDLKVLMGLIVQSDRLGASMAKTLRAHADLLRTKRRQRAEEMARKLPIKMLFPLAMLILPALLIATMGPAALSLNEMFKTLRRG